MTSDFKIACDCARNNSRAQKNLWIVFGVLNNLYDIKPTNVILPHQAWAAFRNGRRVPIHRDRMGGPGADGEYPWVPRDVFT